MPLPPRSFPSETGNPPWWKGATIYQIYPRSFRDTNGDGIGDLVGIIDGLDHIASLGVDAIWISPFFTSPMRDYGYDIADYCDVDPSFGTLEDFDRLVARAHDLGLKVVIDQVYSHTSEDHAWFAESRSSKTNGKADWYVWADPKPDGSPPSNWQSVFGGPSWQWDARRQQYYLHNFLTSQPDLNLHNPEVQDALLEVSRFWLSRGVDGFRLDAINFAMHDPELRDNPPSGLDMAKVTRPFDMQSPIHSRSHPDIPRFLERIRGVMDEYGVTFSVAEVVGADPVPEMKRFIQGEAHLNTAYSFDFLYAPTISPKRVQRSLKDWLTDADKGWPSWAFSNHDAPRAVTRWSNGSNDDAQARQYLMLLASLRGNIFIYQGEELGLPQGEVAFEHLKDPEAIENWPRTLGRDGARTPFPWQTQSENAGFSTGTPWLPVDPAQAALALDHQKEDPTAFLHFAKQVIATRQASPALKLGDLAFLDTPDPVLAFLRETEAQRVLCVYNLSDTPVSWALDTKINTHTRKRVLLASNGMSNDHQLDVLAPRTSYWEELDGDV